MRNEAIKLAKQGYRVIPLDGKRPIWESWQQKALSEPFDVFEQWPEGNYNVGIACGGGLVVLDVDPSNDGFAALARLQESIGQLPETRTVRTQSGGLHFYFAMPDGVDVSNSAKVLQERFGAGLDIRGAGGQVVAPGSTFKGKPYVLERDAAHAPIPGALLAALQSAPTRAANAGAIACELDDPAAVAACERWLEASPEVNEGGRDNAAFAMAARFYDFGVTEQTCRELLDIWSEKKCYPSLDDDALDRIASSAGRNRQDVIGRDNPTLGFDVIEGPPNPLRARLAYFTQTEDDDANMPVRPWLADRRLIRGKLSSLVAPGSIGKSLITLQWAAALARGDGAFCGFGVRQKCRVLLINNEDENEEMKMRLAAVTRYFRLEREPIKEGLTLLSGSEDPLLFVKKLGRNGNLTEAETVKHIEDLCASDKFDVVIIDPLVDSHEANENDNSEMSKVMRTFRKLAKKCDVAVLLVHHTKKPPAAGSEGFAGSADAGRGATAVVNAVRVGMTLFNMSPKDGDKFGVPAARQHLHVRLDDAKANLFLASPEAQWFERVTVNLPNGESSGVLVPVKLTDRTADADRLLVAEVAALVRDRPMGVAELVAALKAGGFIEGTKSTITRKLAAALESGASAAGLVWDKRGTSTGGTVSATLT